MGSLFSVVPLIATLFMLFGGVRLGYRKQKQNHWFLPFSREFPVRYEVRDFYSSLLYSTASAALILVNNTPNQGHLC